MADCSATEAVTTGELMMLPAADAPKRPALRYYVGKLTDIVSKLKPTRLGWQEVVVIAFTVSILAGVSVMIPGGDDWYGVFLPATRLLLSGHSPYNEPMFFSPVWTLITFVPLALLPPAIGRAVLFLVALVAFALSAQRLGGKPFVIMVFLLSPPVVFSLWLASLDWMPLLGFVLAPQIGLFLIAAKPQMGSLVALFWLVESWRKGGLREVIRVFAPVTVALLGTFVLYGLWPLRASQLVIIEHNATLWPVSIPIGLALVIASLRKRELGYAMAASPCLTPYVMFPTWSGALAALTPAVPEMIAAVIGLWLLVIIRAFA